jgi:hypothetical protein
MSSGVGLCIEYWKFTKAFKFNFTRVNRADQSSSGVVSSIMSLLPYKIDWEVAESYSQDQTREYDAIAVSHLLYVVVPLVMGYSVYSLLHISVLRQIFLLYCHRDSFYNTF